MKLFELFTRKTTMFDFEDGKGHVPAHRHKNSDGNEGGWVANTAFVSSTAYINKDAQVYDSARVFGNARVGDSAWVFGNARVGDSARVLGNARVCDSARVDDSARVFGNAQVLGDAWVGGKARVLGNARVCDSAQVLGDAWVLGSALVCDNALVLGVARLSASIVSGFSVVLNGSEILTPEFITSAWLRGRGACEDQVVLFEKVFPAGAKPTKANLNKAKKKGLNVDWLVGFLAASGGVR